MSTHNICFCEIGKPCTWYPLLSRPMLFVFILLGSDGCLEVTFGVLFNDDRCANIFEALVGTLRAAKRKKVISYDGELLLQGVHDNTVIILLKDELWWCVFVRILWHLFLLHFFFFFITVFTLNIGTSWFLTILVLKFEKCFFLLPFDVFKTVLDEWQTV